MLRYTYIACLVTTETKCVYRAVRTNTSSMIHVDHILQTVIAGNRASKHRALHMADFSGLTATSRESHTDHPLITIYSVWQRVEVPQSCLALRPASSRHWSSPTARLDSMYLDHNIKSSALPSKPAAFYYFELLMARYSMNK